MVVLGITGPTGAGKTTLLGEVEKLGGAVIDCDAVYHEMLEKDIALQCALESAFGPLRDKAGQIDRKKLGRIVFRDQAQLKRLNTIAQTAVVERTRELIEAYREQGRSVVAVDAIALLESTLKNLCQLTVAVLAPAEVRVGRIVIRESIPEDYAWARVKAQKENQYFAKNCDITLINDCASAEEFAAAARKKLGELIQL